MQNHDLNIAHTTLTNMRLTDQMKFKLIYCGFWAGSTCIVLAEYFFYSADDA